MVGIPINSATRAAALVKKYALGGILVRGLPTKASKSAIARIVAAGGEIAPFIGVDEEGGRVQHLRAAVGVMPSARTMATTMTPEQVRAIVHRHAKGMRALGFTVDFGPVLDLLGPPTNGIGDRAFSGDPNRAATYGLAFAQGLIDGGIFPVVKHFPGHGSASGDSHQIGARTLPVNEMRVRDMVAFAQVIATAPVGVMMGHIDVPGLDGRPASISAAAVHGLLRGELKYKGLVVTDSLSMRPIRYHYPPPEAAVQALWAGNDVLLFDDEPGVAAIVNKLVKTAASDPDFAGRVVESVERILLAKGLPACRVPEATTSTTSTTILLPGSAESARMGP